MTNDNELQSLQDKINAARGLKKVPQSSAKNENSREGVQAGIELVVAIFAGGAIGYGLDQWLDTQPLFMIILFFLGVATGFYNVYRVTQNLGTAVGSSASHKKSEDSDLSEPEKDVNKSLRHSGESRNLED